MRDNQHPEYTYNYNQGIMYLNSENFEKALTAFEKARNYWDNSYAYSGMGRAYYGLGEYLLALTNFETACQMYRGNLQAAHWRAKTLGKLKRYNEAEALFKNVLSILSNGPVNFHEEVLRDYETMKDERDGGVSDESKGRNLSNIYGKEQPTTRVFIQGNQAPVCIGGIQATDDAVINRAHVETTGNSGNNGSAKVQSAKPDNKYLQLSNEYENFRNRSKRDMEIAINSATKKIVLDMLEVVDNFERAIKNEDEKQIEGLIQIHKFFLAALSRNGIEKMNVDGQMFNPMFHEAIAYLPSDKPDGTIIDVAIPGYTMNDKVIRHAQVAVAAEKTDDATTKSSSIESSDTFAKSTKPKFCSQCGASLDDDCNFCPRCGRKLV